MSRIWVVARYSDDRFVGSSQSYSSVQAAMRHFGSPPEGPVEQELVWFPIELVPNLVADEIAAWGQLDSLHTQQEFAALESASGEVVGFLFRCGVSFSLTGGPGMAEERGLIRVAMVTAPAGKWCYLISRRFLDLDDVLGHIMAANHHHWLSLQKLPSGPPSLGLAVWWPIALRDFDVTNVNDQGGLVGVESFLPIWVGEMVVAYALR